MCVLTKNWQSRKGEKIEPSLLLITTINQLINHTPFQMRWKSSTLYRWPWRSVVLQQELYRLQRVFSSDSWASCCCTALQTATMSSLAHFVQSPMDNATTRCHAVVSVHVISIADNRLLVQCDCRAAACHRPITVCEDSWRSIDDDKVSLVIPSLRPIDQTPLCRLSPKLTRGESRRHKSWKSATWCVSQTFMICVLSRSRRNGI